MLPTLCSMFRQFGYGFYAINIPVCLGLQSLKKAGMTNEYEHLKDEFIKSGDVFVKNGMNYPKHEVNYEQSIVLPPYNSSYNYTLKQVFENTSTKPNDNYQYWKPLTVVNPAIISMTSAFAIGMVTGSANGNSLAIRCRTIGVRLRPKSFIFMPNARGRLLIKQRAEEIVRNNLCLFFEDGKASCAYVYPHEVNGIKAQFYDEYANDQDWALVHYLLVNKGL